MVVATALDAPGRPARASRRALHSRVSAGHLVMIVAGLIGALGTLAALRAADHRVEVLIARHELAPGAVVGADAFRAVRIGADAGTMTAFVRATDVHSLVGQVVTTRIAAGGFVSSADVSRASTGASRRSMSFPVDRSHALNGQVVGGDRVDVVAVDARTGGARYVATGAEVLRVDGGGGRGPLGGSDSITVTLAVDPKVALDIATAVHGKDLTLVRATGAAAFRAADTAVPSR
ncbi:MAG: hypothetical protein JWL83_1264 [Actinomycetia bacterium]|nr:hypothetical protein [Actinomycetes bacterium]